MSLLIFSKLFTRRRLQREQEAARPLLERSEGSGLHLARGKRPPTAKCIKKNNEIYIQHRLFILSPFLENLLNFL
jgi:hypothetical protein